MPLRSDLLVTHAEYDGETWADYEALYKGGKAMRERVRRFLVQNPQEPDDVYAARCRAAHYHCYLGSIVDYFANYLVTSPLVVRAKESDALDAKVVDPDPFYAAFKEDCDARDNDLMLFMRRRVVEALIKRRAWWLVEMPQTEVAEGEVASRADWEAKKLGDGHLCALDAEQVLDWCEDGHGEIEWARVFSCSKRRPSPVSKAVTVTERWEIFDRKDVTIYELSYDEGHKPATEVEVPRIGEPKPHGFQSVPLLRIDLEDGLWVANRLSSPQIEHFALLNALTWAIRRTCFALAILKREDPNAAVDVMGAGYYLNLGPNDSFEWSAPSNTPFTEIRETVNEQKDEIYRVIHAMALGVDNNAAAIGRSAESKVVDANVVRVILAAIGTVVREAIERCYEKLSEARGDTYEWAIEGLDSFEEVDVAPLVEAITAAMALNIPSPTWRKEALTRTAVACVPTASQDVKDAIKTEIEDGVDAQEEEKAKAKAEAEKAAKVAAANPPPAAPAPGAPTPPGTSAGASPPAPPAQAA